jgi:cytochrome c biogenesis protein CcdA
VLQALIVVTGIALADSVNPATIGPGVVLAMSEHPSRRVLEFTTGAFIVNVAGGALLVLGPGQWLLSVLPSPSHHVRHVAELAVGAVLIAGAAAVWLIRHRLAERDLPGTRAQPGKALTAGATLMLLELPTAFPYFAAIAAIVGLDTSLWVELLLVCLFNVIFLAPLLVIAIVVRFSSGVRTTVIEPVASWLQLRWPVMLAVALTVLSVVLLVAGARGLVSE